jgi:transcriptional regulator with XRE-family HTH domain
MSNGVKNIRLTLGMSQEAFARAIGKTQPAVANYEGGYRTPEPETAYVIIDLAKNAGLNISLENIYPRDDQTIAHKP